MKCVVNGQNEDGRINLTVNFASIMSNIKLNTKVFTTGEASKPIKPIGRGEFHKNSKELDKQFNPAKSLNGI